MRHRVGHNQSDYRLARSIFLRALAFIYLVAFAVIIDQWPALLGENGLLPVSVFLKKASSTGALRGLFYAPSLFWFSATDAFAMGLAYSGLALAALLFVGFGNALTVFLLWLIYGSFVHVGQIFYQYGWEIMLLETTFLAIFLCAPWRGFYDRLATSPSTIVIWLFRWLIFRVMFGAGLIKLRGDACWQELTCLAYHYETQPVPHPLSWLLHQFPLWFHKAGVLWNHFVELVVPWFLFAPGLIRMAAVLLLIGFQIALILSGNLSWLNWLTIAICLAGIEGRYWRMVLPTRLVRRIEAQELMAPGPASRLAAVGLLAVVALLSIGPIINMVSPNQAMNRSFEPLHLVNTYGAFGTVGKVRHEIVLEGTSHGNPADPAALWQEYGFHCKPTAVENRPCLITPYHYRLDWQMWFAAMGRVSRQPWLLHFVAKLLAGDHLAKSLLAHDPFAGQPPRFIRARLFRYQLTSGAERGWWRRQLVRDYMPPLSLQTPSLQRMLLRSGLRLPEQKL